MSTVYFLWRLPHATLTCIDPFESVVFGEAAQARPLRETFDRNIGRVDPARVHEMVQDSKRALLDLHEQGARFDLIYVDGSHLGLDVIVDAALSWRVLEPGGEMVFDDYTWNDNGEDALLRPGPAIDAMLTLLEGKFEEVSRGSQIAVRKLSPS
jgi:hypothetical protein